MRPNRSQFALESRQHTKGFTLLELSIVLVIIGLLIGGVFVGQSLIHNAQLNAVITEYSKYEAGTQAFKQTYLALPGDMANATSIWGVAGGTGSDAACQTAASTTTATCNGNGDGIIYTSTGSFEPLRFWQHLANAKIIEGSYTGVVGAGAVVGTNVPSSKFTPAGWGVLWTGQWSGGIAGNLYNADWGTGTLYVVGGTGGGDPWPEGNAMSPKDVWSIDKKIDDGKPGRGNVLVRNYATCTNSADFNDLGASYSLNNSGTVCAPVFIAGF